MREQEFGNFQVKEEMRWHSETASEVGRFYYRRPTGESGADVYDRAASFWDDLFMGAQAEVELQHVFTPTNHAPDDALLIVTHGLTMRILLMRYFQWSPQTFDAVYNPGNGDLWVLKKHASERRYVLEPRECWPPRMPWATRQIRLVMRDPSSPRSRNGLPADAASPSWDFDEAPQASMDLDEGLREAGGDQSRDGIDYTLVDYLRLPQPRTSHPEASLQLLLPGHGHKLDPSREAGSTPEARMAFIDAVVAQCRPVPPEGVESIDWWCGKISAQGKALRTAEASEVTSRRASLKLLRRRNARGRTGAPA